MSSPHCLNQNISLKKKDLQEMTKTSLRTNTEPTFSCKWSAQVRLANRAIETCIFDAPEIAKDAGS